MSNPNTFPPAFTAAMQHYQLVARLHGDESEKARNAFTSAMLKAPEWFRDEANQMARDMGLLPPASGYLDNGEPIYTLSDVAEHLGVSIEHAMQQVKSIEAIHEAQGLPFSSIDPALINRRQ